MKLKYYSDIQQWKQTYGYCADGPPGGSHFGFDVDAMHHIIRYPILFNILQD